MKSVITKLFSRVCSGNRKKEKEEVPSISRPKISAGGNNSNAWKIKRLTFAKVGQVHTDFKYNRPLTLLVFPRERKAEVEQTNMYVVMVTLRPINGEKKVNDNNTAASL